MLNKPNHIHTRTTDDIQVREQTETFIQLYKMPPKLQQNKWRYNTLSPIPAPTFTSKNTHTHTFTQKKENKRNKGKIHHLPPFLPITPHPLPKQEGGNKQGDQFHTLCYKTGIYWEENWPTPCEFWPLVSSSLDVYFLTLPNVLDGMSALLCRPLNLISSSSALWRLSGSFCFLGLGVDSEKAKEQEEK